jgi:hypothetical protein
MELPESVLEVVDVIGMDQALFLVGRLPRIFRPGHGDRVNLYVPKRLKLDHDLVKWLGYVDALKLVKEFGGIILQLSQCACVYREFRDENIVRLVNERTPIAMVASWFDVSERHVKNLMRTEKPHEDERRAANDNRGLNQPYGRRRNDIKNAAA